jgi:hypothetical protein
MTANAGDIVFAPGTSNPPASRAAPAGENIFWTPWLPAYGPSGSMTGPSGLKIRSRCAAHRETMTAAWAIPQARPKRANGMPRERLWPPLTEAVPARTAPISRATPEVPTRPLSPTQSGDPPQHHRPAAS